MCGGRTDRVCMSVTYVLIYSIYIWPLCGVRFEFTVFLQRLLTTLRFLKHELRTILALPFRHFSHQQLSLPVFLSVHLTLSTLIALSADCIFVNVSSPNNIVRISLSFASLTFRVHFPLLYRYFDFGRARPVHQPAVLCPMFVAWLYTWCLDCV